jgi:ArsR family transcriptional regulator
MDSVKSINPDTLLRGGTKTMSELKELATVSRALSDETRLHILEILLTRGETCVCELMETLHMTQSNVSFHLTTLKHAGLIGDRKMGKWMFYTINLSALEQYLSSLREVFNEKRCGAARSATSVFALCGGGQDVPLSREQVRRKVAKLKRGWTSRRQKV